MLPAGMHFSATDKLFVLQLIRLHDEIQLGGHILFDPNEPIETMEQAERFFKGMGCSSFHMMREYNNRKLEYDDLHIPPEIENKWRTEYFDELCTAFLNVTAPSDFWWKHSNIEKACQGLRTDYALTKTLELTEFIRDKVPEKDRVLVAENIAGRASRDAHSGLIHLAYEMDNIPAAKSFAELALYFADYHGEDDRLIVRCRKATELCGYIQRKLGL